MIAVDNSTRAVGKVLQLSSHTEACAVLVVITVMAAFCAKT